MEENKNIIENQSEESSIDFVAIWKAILKHRKLYYKVLPVTFIIMCIYTLSLPNYYKCVVTLAPEMGGKGGSGSGLAALASSFGVNIGGGNAAGGRGRPRIAASAAPRRRRRSAEQEKVNRKRKRASSEGSSFCHSIRFFSLVLTASRSLQVSRGIRRSISSSRIDWSGSRIVR